ncbi:TPA: VOC family protein [Streptococcus agalactiae]
MVKALETYIVTNGNGRQAIDFYKNVFQADLVNMMTWEEMDPNCLEDRKDLIINAQLIFDSIRLQISDENPDFVYQAGKNVTAAIIVGSVEEAREIYEKLKKNAQEVQLELQETFWSPAYANLVDQFGVMWQISTELN